MGNWLENCIPVELGSLEFRSAAGRTPPPALASGLENVEGLHRGRRTPAVNDALLECTSKSASLTAAGPKAWAKLARASFEFGRPRGGAGAGPPPLQGSHPGRPGCMFAPKIFWENALK